MLNKGDDFFVQFPSQTDERVLHPAIVVDVRDDQCVAELKGQDLTPEAEQDILVYYEHSRQFMQQPAQIDWVVKTDTEPIVCFITTGERVSAERRECYRVCTVMTDLVAKLGPETCPLLDVSVTGFAVVAPDRCGVAKVGNVVNATLNYEDEQYTGEARIQSVRDLGAHKIRYGLFALTGAKAGNLPYGQQKIGMALQREQLRRRARLA